jgi:hypothetical protein
MRRSPRLDRATKPAASPVLNGGVRVVGRVEGSMSGSSEEAPDALSVRFSVRRRRRRLVPVAAIDAIDERTKVIGLRVDREAISAFL